MRSCGAGMHSCVARVCSCRPRVRFCGRGERNCLRLSAAPSPGVAAWVQFTAVPALLVAVSPLPPPLPGPKRRSPVLLALPKTVS